MGAGGGGGSDMLRYEGGIIFYIKKVENSVKYGYEQTLFL